MEFSVWPQFLSVIVVVYNGATYLQKALDSITAQTRVPDEIIVVDGPSTDATPEIAQAVAGLRYLRQPKRGLAEARNVGVSAARGDLIAFLDHDDWWEPNKLEKQLANLNIQPSPPGNLTWVKLFLEPGSALRPGFKSQAFETGQPGFTPGTLLAKRSLFYQIGGFDPAYTIGCDADWFARVQDAGIQLEVIPHILLHKRIHEHNLSAQIDLYTRDLKAILVQSIKRKRTNNASDY
jgi:glycosyltransferase involved in cell wall biosynthesis